MTEKGAFSGPTWEPTSIRLPGTAGAPKDYRPADSWQFKAIKATRGNRSRLGCILLAALKMNARHPPQFSQSGAIITSDGFIQADYRAGDGSFHHGAFVGSVEEYTSNFRGLADYLKLSDADREALFVVARSWIAIDYRSDKEILGRKT